MPSHSQLDVITPISNFMPVQSPSTLVIGDLDRWKAQGQLNNDMKDIEFINFNDVTFDVISDTGAEIILSPLIGDDFDAVEVAIKLASFSYRGRYRAVADEIPNADMVRSEVLAITPHLDFDLFLLSA